MDDGRSIAIIYAKLVILCLGCFCGLQLRCLLALTEDSHEIFLACTISYVNDYDPLWNDIMLLALNWGIIKIVQKGNVCKC